jgi:rare lipoprotein A (peptidoglycan hydrolase)
MIIKSAIITTFFAITNLITPSTDDKVNVGTASFYAKKFEGKRTSSGQRYRASERTAAHRTYPFGTLLEVTNRANGSKTTVRVNDRGPHSKSRLIDLSLAAAKDLGLVSSGTANVSIKVISLGNSADNQAFESEILEEEEKSAAPIYPTFKPDFLEKKHQYMLVVKQADGSMKVEYSDVRPK